MTNKDVVLAFISAWNEINWAAIEQFMTDDIRYHNIPWIPVETRENVMANLAGFGVEASDWITHNIVNKTFLSFIFNGLFSC